MYQILGTVVYVAMSGDATCRGLRSPRDGPLVMEFTKGKDSKIDKKSTGQSIINLTRDIVFDQYSDVSFLGGKD